MTQNHELLVSDLYDQAAIGTLKDQVWERLQSSQNLTLNLQDINKVGTAGLQFILSCIMSAQQLKKEFKLINPTESFTTALKLTGLDNAFKNRGIEL